MIIQSDRHLYFCPRLSFFFCLPSSLRSQTNMCQHRNCSIFSVNKIVSMPFYLELNAKQIYDIMSEQYHMLNAQIQPTTQQKMSSNQDAVLIKKNDFALKKCKNGFYQQTSKKNVTKLIVYESSTEFTELITNPSICVRKANLFGISTKTKQITASLFIFLCSCTSKNHTDSSGFTQTHTAWRKVTQPFFGGRISLHKLTAFAHFINYIFAFLLFFFVSKSLGHELSIYN